MARLTPDFTHVLSHEYGKLRYNTSMVALFG